MALDISWDLSLHIMDIAQNSITANASLIEIFIDEDKSCGTLEILIGDNGCGINEEKLAWIISLAPPPPTIRRGRGIPLLRAACEATGGVFAVESKPGVGTSVKAVFITAHEGMPPHGNIGETIRLLKSCNPNITVRENFTFESV